MTTATCTPLRNHLGDLPGHLVHDIGVQADFTAAEHLAAELE